MSMIVTLVLGIVMLGIILHRIAVDQGGDA